MSIEWVVWFAVYLAVFIVEVNRVVPIIIAIIVSITSRIVSYYCGTPWLVQEITQSITFMLVAYAGLVVYEKVYKRNGVEVLESLIGKRCTVIEFTGKDTEGRECIISVDFEEFKGLVEYGTVIIDDVPAEVVGVENGHLIIRGVDLDTYVNDSDL